MKVDPNPRPTRTPISPMYQTRTIDPWPPLRLFYMEFLTEIRGELDFDREFLACCHSLLERQGAHPSLLFPPISLNTKLHMECIAYLGYRVAWKGANSLLQFANRSSLIRSSSPYSSAISNFCFPNHFSDIFKLHLTRISHHNRSYITSTMTLNKQPVSSLYRSKIEKKLLRYDKCQELTLEQLDPLSVAIVNYESKYIGLGFPLKLSQIEPAVVPKSSSLWTMIQSSWNSSTEEYNGPRLESQQGIYLFGDVGTGKTMLMDLFLEATPLQMKQRVHFNSFMLSFHNSLHTWRQSPLSKTQSQASAIETIADSILNKSPLLCFDEFQVTNIADAMILNRLFHTLWLKGAVIVATSNRPPDDLYKGGLQRENFTPFIAELKQKCIIHDIGSSVDYRLTGHRSKELFINKSKSNTKLESIWNDLTENRPGESMELKLMSRSLIVPKAIKGIAMFSFMDLCAKPLGAADYGLIGSTFHTILIKDIPILSIEAKDYVRRFITLIDELYEHRVKVICSADADMAGIFPYHIDPAKKGDPLMVSAEEEMFAFSRTLSRLNEMQTAEYLQAKHVPSP